ncbi:unnamed protein product [Symbiodinium pilosum]|uniref:Uncharacterized protein n=1 Tax=Symbiodinium pilosum TaxID=2952 RepID=A0A812QX96_SYMPI|nr:unnamed protein product [Symbiodinium pilosum]
MLHSVLSVSRRRGWLSFTREPPQTLEELLAMQTPMSTCNAANAGESKRARHPFELNLPSTWLDKLEPEEEQEAGQADAAIYATVFKHWSPGKTPGPSMIEGFFLENRPHFEEAERAASATPAFTLVGRRAVTNKGQEENGELDSYVYMVWTCVEQACGNVGSNCSTSFFENASWIATVQLGTTSFEAVLFVRICQELSPKWMMLIDRLSALQDSRLVRLSRTVAQCLLEPVGQLPFVLRRTCYAPRMVCRPSSTNFATHFAVNICSGYHAVSGQDSCCLDGQRLCVVACCMMSFLCIGTAAMLHLAPHHVAAGADYIGVDQHVVHGMQKHVSTAADWARSVSQTAHQVGSDWVRNSGLDTHLRQAGQWGSTVGQHAHRVGADIVAGAGLDEHMQRAGDWAQQVHQQLTGQDQILSPYDCSTAGDIPSWSHAHKEWCCEHQNIACAEASSTASTSHPPQHYMWISVPLHKGKYDCAAGIKNWLKGWSHRKQSWCCQNKGIGCLHEVSHPFDCSIGSATHWPAQKTVWCCLHQNRGCPSQVTFAQAHAFDCSAGFSNWQVGWSVAKQEWCCMHHGRGCRQTSEATSYDCSDDLYHWHDRWSSHKKAWCCKTYSLGCSAKHVNRYDCDAGYANWRAGWSDGKKAWCCARTSRGCLYDCEAVDQSWSFARRSWCCWHLRQGCTSEDAYDATSVESSAEDSHAVSYIDNNDFDCDAGYANWHAGWSQDKKNWCCQHLSLGCESPFG